MPGDGTWPARARATQDADDPDARAVARAQAGDRQAFRTLVDRHSRRLYRVAYRLTGRHEDAEDVVQETFLRAYRQLARFEARAAVTTWLYRIAVNCAVDLLRTRPDRETLDPDAVPEAGTSRGEPVAADPSPDRLVASVEIRRRLARGFQRLSPTERTAFVLRHMEGRSIAEISRVLGLRASATKHSIFRAVRKLRAALEPLAATLEAHSPGARHPRGGTT